MKLIIVRHGQCQANARGLAAGAGDNSFLTVRGVSQSDAAAHRLAHRRFSAIVSSPLRRTVQTAEILRDQLAPNLAIETNANFKEIDIGTATDGPDADYLAMQRAGIIPPGGETFEHFYERVSHGLEQLKQREGTILLVSHQGTARIIDCLVHGWPPSRFRDLPGLDNGEFKEIEL
jgi:alpha-ribazole phosphatase